MHAILLKTGTLLPGLWDKRIAGVGLELGRAQLAGSRFGETALSVVARNLSPSETALRFAQQQSKTPFVSTNAHEYPLF
jgi:hypothetical protein